MTTQRCEPWEMEEEEYADDEITISNPEEEKHKEAVRARLVEEGKEDEFVEMKLWVPTPEEDQLIYELQMSVDAVKRTAKVILGLQAAIEATSRAALAVDEVAALVRLFP